MSCCANCATAPIECFGIASPCGCVVDPPAPCPGGPMVLEAPLPYFTGFPKYPYATFSPSPFGAAYGTHGGEHYFGPFDSQTHAHMLYEGPLATSAFGAVSPKLKRQIHMVAEALGLAVAAPMVWWASNQTQEPRHRMALRALAAAMAAIDAGFLAWNAYDMYQERRP